MFWEKSPTPLSAWLTPNGVTYGMGLGWREQMLRPSLYFRVVLIIRVSSLVYSFNMRQRRAESSSWAFSPPIPYPLIRILVESKLRTINCTPYLIILMRRFVPYRKCIFVSRWRSIAGYVTEATCKKTLSRRGKATIRIFKTEFLEPPFRYSKTFFVWR